VALAYILAEDRTPDSALWEETLVSSRLAEYEIWTRLHSKKLGASHGHEAREILSRIAFVDLSPPVLARALEPFPMPVRTLDAIHLSTMDFLMRKKIPLLLASYDQRLTMAAESLKIRLADY
jgi:hypothetical protein